MAVAIATLYCDRLDVEAVLSAEGVTLRLDDDGGNAENAVESGYLDNYALNWATAEVNYYILQHYKASELAKSWVVNQYAADFAAEFLCRRRGNPVPKSLMDRVGRRELETGHYYQLSRLANKLDVLADIQARLADTLAWSNHSFDDRWPVRKMRLTRRLSEDTLAVGRPAAHDYPAEYSRDW